LRIARCWRCQIIDRPGEVADENGFGGLTAAIESYQDIPGRTLSCEFRTKRSVHRGSALFRNVSGYLRHGSHGVRLEANSKDVASWDKDTVFVPGHDPSAARKELPLRALFDDIEDQAEKMHKAGVPAADAADLYVVPEKYRMSPFLPGTSPFRQRLQSCMRNGSKVGLRPRRGK